MHVQLLVFVSYSQLIIRMCKMVDTDRSISGLLQLLNIVYQHFHFIFGTYKKKLRVRKTRF